MEFNYIIGFGLIALVLIGVIIWLIRDYIKDKEKIKKLKQ